MGIACKPVSTVSYPENEGKEMTDDQNSPFMAQRCRSREHGSQVVSEAGLLAVDPRVRSLNRQSHPWPLGGGLKSSLAEGPNPFIHSQVSRGSMI